MNRGLRGFFLSSHIALCALSGPGFPSEHLDTRPLQNLSCQPMTRANHSSQNTSEGKSFRTILYFANFLSQMMSLFQKNESVLKQDYLCVCMLTHSVISNSLWPQGLQPTRLLCPWNSPGKKYWSGLPFPSPGDLPDSGMECASLAPSALAGRFFTSGITWEALSSLKKTYLGGAFLRPCSQALRDHLPSVTQVLKWPHHPINL